MNIILRPLMRNSWPGIIKYKNCYEDLSPYFTRSGRIYTGLTKADEERLGELLGEDLTPGSEFWKTFYIRTYGKDMFFNIEDPLDELKYLHCKNHKRVKASLAENKATANFVLINKEEEARRTNVANEAKLEAMTAFGKLSSEEMRKCLRLFGRNADSMSDQLAKNRLFEIVEGDPHSFLKRWVNNESRETEYLLEAALSRNIIRRSKNLYKFGTDTIGHTLHETIDFLDNPKNQDIKISITKQIESKNFIASPEPKPEPVMAPEEKKISAVDITAPEEVEEAIKSRPSKRKKGDTI